VRNFIENPNLGIQRVSTHPESIVEYFLKYKEVNFKNDPLFIKSFRQLAPLELRNVWWDISTKRTLSYCLNNFPHHTKDIVDMVMGSIHFKSEFLEVIDKYKDDLYSTLQKKKALTWVSRKRTLCNSNDDDLDYNMNISRLVDEMNNTTAFLLKKNKSF
jgi:hypothetical protein